MSRIFKVCLTILLLILSFMLGALASPLIYPRPGLDATTRLSQRAALIRQVLVEDGHPVSDGSAPGDQAWILEISDLNQWHLYLHSWGGGKNGTVQYWITPMYGGYIPTFSFLAITSGFTWIVIYRVYDIKGD